MPSVANAERAFRITEHILATLVTTELNLDIHCDHYNYRSVSDYLRHAINFLQEKKETECSFDVKKFLSLRGKFRIRRNEVVKRCQIEFSSTLVFDKASNRFLRKGREWKTVHLIRYEDFHEPPRWTQRSSSSIDQPPIQLPFDEKNLRAICQLRNSDLLPLRYRMTGITVDLCNTLQEEFPNIIIDLNTEGYSEII